MRVWLRERSWPHPEEEVPAVREDTEDREVAHRRRIALRHQRIMQLPLRITGIRLALVIGRDLRVLRRIPEH